MFDVWLYAIVSVLIVSAISLVGIVALSLKAEKLKNILFLLVSFAAGALLGDVFIHLLPEAIEEAGEFTLALSLSVLAGIAFMFLIEKLIHWRHCHVVPEENHVHPFATMNLIGDAVHNIIDGIIIGASYLVSIPVGIATTVAVILHEIPQEISDFGVLLHGGYSKKKALFVNFLTALGAVLGVVVALIIGASSETLVGYLVPFAAGAFIYIAGADLIPELHKEVGAKRSVMQFFVFLLGVAVMLLLIVLE